MLDFTQIAGFDWDLGNREKSPSKHGVSQREAEEIFLDPRLLVLVDDKHSGEARYHAYGSTAAGRLLRASFTLRRNATFIRVISARPMAVRRELAMAKKLKTVPKFRSEAEERAFWETHDTANYFDLSKAQRASFPNLKLSTTAISLRVPQRLLDRIKIAANKRDVPYQSLIKVWLTEKVDGE
jgi:uncharacterized DUF497 family protein